MSGQMFAAGRRVLFIGEQSSRATHLRSVLRPLGWTALFAETGEDALWGMEADPPECVVVDLGGPVLDGWFVLARLGALVPRPRLVAFSAEAADAQRATDLGADAFVDERHGVVDAIAGRSVAVVA